MIGTLLNQRYRLDAELGQGGMGVVYRGYDTLLGREVAIKVLSQSSQARLGTEGRARLLHEARSAAGLNHPNIVAIYDAGEADKVPFVVMELLNGESLYDHTPGSLADMLAIARHICAALAHAHSHGIVHRDLKPENIIISTNGKVSLTDFGLARSLSSRLTADGLIVGTVFYMAPEMALRKQVDGRTDLYSLGVILYEMVTNSLPFTGDDPLGVISQHLYAPLVPPHVHRPDLPPALDELIVKLLSKEPDARPASPDEVGQVLKLIEKQVRAEPSGPSQPFPTLDRLARGRLVGREREMAEISALWRQANLGHGSTLLVSGEAGIGKTRLVHELIAKASVSGNRVLSGVCYAEGGLPYTPFPQFIQETVTGPGNGFLTLPDYVLADLSAISPQVRSLFPGIAPNPPLDPRTEQQRGLESVTAWLEALAAQSPLLLFIDDIHWADSGTLFLLRHLARRASRMPMLLAATYRELELDESGALRAVLSDLTRERLATRFKLPRFSKEQTEEMLGLMLVPKGAVDPALLDAIYHETEGNPFFIEEVTKALIEENKLTLTESGWAAPEAAEVDIPQSVRVTIQGRLGRLPQPVQDVLRLAAVFGRRFEFDLLRAAADINEDQLIEALEIAEQAQIITEMPGAKGKTPRFSFAHGLIPNTLRDGMSSLRRQRLHRRAAGAIALLNPADCCQYETLAYHYEQAGDAEKARDHYLQAANRALTVYANQEAERYFRAALDLNEPGEEGDPLVMARLGEALFRQSRYEQAFSTWKEAVRQCRHNGDHENMARLYARAARAAWYAGDPPRGLRICREGMEALKEMGLTPGNLESYGMAALLHETARACHFNNLEDEALPLCRQALEMAEKLGLEEVRADALATFGILRNVSQAEARQALLQAVEIAEKSDLSVIAVRAHTNLAENMYTSGDLEGALHQYQRGAELARQMGIRAWEHDQLMSAIGVALDMGDLPLAEKTLPVVRQLNFEAESSFYSKVVERLMESRLLHQQGKHEQALEILNACLEEARQEKYDWLIPDITLQIGEALTELERLEEAEQLLVPVLTETGHFTYAYKVWAAHSLSTVYLRQNRLADAIGLREVKPDPEGKIEKPITMAAPMWIENRLAAAHHRWDEALSGYEHTYNYLVQNGLGWRQAKLMEEWAQVYLDRGLPGDREQAVSLLQQAETLYQKMGAQDYSERAAKRQKI